MSHHRTRSDAAFFALVKHNDEEAKLGDLLHLTQELAEAEEAGIEADWTDLDELADDLESDGPVGAEDIDAVRANLRAQIGIIRRGEVTSQESQSDASQQ